jgi:non-structural maintenance of chromosomes element 4
MVTAISAVLNRTGEDGVTLFEFVVDPKSFAQSVENLFYVSFLVKEGKAAVYPRELEGGGEGVLMLCECFDPLSLG